jgi:type VI protein secretion system component VasF
MPNEFSKYSKQLPTPVMGEFSLLEQFEEFLGFWLKLKEELIKHIGGQQAFSYEEGLQITDIPLYLQTQLILFAEQQRADVVKVATRQQQKYYEASLYATISMIDEQLLQQIEWPHSEDWLKLMLEKALFGTRNAGSKLIDRMESLVDSEHTPSQLERQLAEIYLRILRLSFDGKYHNDEQKVETLISKLAKFSTVKIFDLASIRLFKQAYQYNKNPEHKSRLAPIGFWKRLLLILLIGYPLVTWISVYYITHDLNQKLLSESIFSSDTHRPKD